MADSFKLEFPSYPTSELNELSAEESSGDEVELNEISRGKRWGNNNKHNQKCSSFSNNTTTATDPNKTNLRTANKANSGTKAKRLKDHIDPGVSPLCTH